MRENMKIFLNTTSESDTLHDVVFEVYFYTYTFEYFMSILIKVNFLSPLPRYFRLKMFDFRHIVSL